jgi:signal transduction histidine kinase
MNAAVTSIVVFVILSITIIIFLTSFIISLARKFQAKHKEFEKSTEDLNQSHEHTMLQSYTEVQERTFEDISRELHDNVGQQLSLANFYMQSMDLSDQNKSTTQLEDLKLIMTNAMKDLSNLNKSISNQVLTANGLIYAVERELQLMKNAGIHQVDLQVEGQSSFMNSNAELMLFRVIQELLNNIIKHAKATKVTMKVAYEKTGCTLMLHDNGLGIDTSKVTSSGLGLQNIQKRLSMIKATYRCEPIPRSGTSIHIYIPIYDEQQKQQQQQADTATS